MAIAGATTLVEDPEVWVPEPDGRPQAHAQAGPLLPLASSVLIHGWSLPADRYPELVERLEKAGFPWVDERVHAEFVAAE